MKRRRWTLAAALVLAASAFLVPTVATAHDRGTADSRLPKGFTEHLEVVKDGVGPEDVQVFAKYLKDDAHLRASFEWFRAFPTDIRDNEVNQQTKLRMPVLAVGADHSLKKFLETQVPNYATDVTSVQIANSGHWIWEEHPQEMTQRLLTFLN